MKNKHIVIKHIGSFNSEIIDSILLSIKNLLVKDNYPLIIRKRVYNISVECLDNILKHSDIHTVSKKLYDDNPSSFILEKDDTAFYVKIGNIILNENIKNVDNKLKKINSLNLDGINELYKNSLQNGEISKKGGAGLGLIVMSKTTKEKILYSFDEINNKFSYFVMNLKIRIDN